MAALTTSSRRAMPAGNFASKNRTPSRAPAVFCSQDSGVAYELMEEYPRFFGKIFACRSRCGEVYSLKLQDDHKTQLEMACLRTLDRRVPCEYFPSMIETFSLQAPLSGIRALVLSPLCWGTLEERIGGIETGSGTLPGYSTVTAVKWCFQIASALDALQRINIYNGSVSLKNIMLTAPDGDIRLGEFPVLPNAEIASDEEDMIQQRRASCHSDVFGLGVCVYLIVSVSLPPDTQKGRETSTSNYFFERLACSGGDAVVSAFYSACEEDNVEGVPQEIVDVVSGCLRSRPNRRMPLGLAKAYLEKAHFEQAAILNDEGGQSQSSENMDSSPTSLPINGKEVSLVYEGLWWRTVTSATISGYSSLTTMGINIAREYKVRNGLYNKKGDKILKSAAYQFLFLLRVSISDSGQDRPCLGSLRGGAL